MSYGDAAAEHAAFIIGVVMTEGSAVRKAARVHGVE